MPDPVSDDKDLELNSGYDGKLVKRWYHMRLYPKPNYLIKSFVGMT